jgi:hypothetical protein
MMASSQSQRLRRKAEKASRRKLLVTEKRKAETALNMGRLDRQIIEAARSPIKACVIAEQIFSDGIGWLVLARRLPSGSVAASFFLVDVWCLGIKEAFFSVLPEWKFDEQLKASSEERPIVDIDPSTARKLLHDAAVYANTLGLSPSEGFAEAESLFGDVPMTTEKFEFGKDGKPFYVSGPNDSPTRIRRVIDTLVRRVGEDRFDFLVALDEPHL